MSSHFTGFRLHSERTERIVEFPGSECQYRDATTETPTLQLGQNTRLRRDPPELKFFRLIPLYRTYARSGFWHLLCSYAT